MAGAPRKAGASPPRTAIIFDQGVVVMLVAAYDAGAGGHFHVSTSAAMTYLSRPKVTLFRVANQIFYDHVSNLSALGLRRHTHSRILPVPLPVLIDRPLKCPDQVNNADDVSEAVVFLVFLILCALALPQKVVARMEHGRVIGTGRNRVRDLRGSCSSDDKQNQN